MQDFDSAVPGLGELINGNKGQQAQGAQGAAPQQENPLGSILQRPETKQMLMHTFMAMAQGHDFGGAVANGARGVLLSKAQQKQDAEKQAELDRQQQQQNFENEVTEKKVGFEGQRVGYEGQRVGLEGKRVAQGDERIRQGDEQIELDRVRNTHLNKLTGVQVAEKQQGMRHAEEIHPALVAQAQTKIAQLQEQIASSRDSRKTAALTRQMNSIKMKYLPKQLQQDLDEGFQRRQKLEAETGTAIAEGNIARQKANVWNNLPEDELKGAVLGKEKGKTPQEDYRDFLADHGDMFDLATPEGQEQARQAYVATQEAPLSSAAEAQGMQQRQKEYDEAFNSVKPGEYFNFRGKLIKRPVK